jgi:hypothetical protein
MTINRSSEISSHRCLHVVQLSFCAAHMSANAAAFAALSIDRTRRSDINVVVVTLPSACCRQVDLGSCYIFRSAIPLIALLLLVLLLLVLLLLVLLACALLLSAVRVLYVYLVMRTTLCGDTSPSVGKSSTTLAEGVCTRDSRSLCLLTARAITKSLTPWLEALTHEHALSGRFKVVKRKNS